MWKLSVLNEIVVYHSLSGILLTMKSYIRFTVIRFYFNAFGRAKKSIRNIKRCGIRSTFKVFSSLPLISLFNHSKQILLWIVSITLRLSKNQNEEKKIDTESFEKELLFIDNHWKRLYLQKSEIVCTNDNCMTLGSKLLIAIF